MDDPSRVARLLLESATTLAQATGARGIIVAADALPELEAVPPRTILVARNDEDRKLVAKLTDSAHAAADVPNVELAGKDRKWHKAAAKIVGRTLVVTSDAVAEPVAVRYCYTNIPPGPVLYNAAGLPAAQFRSHAWGR